MNGPIDAPSPKKRRTKAQIEAEAAEQAKESLEHAKIDDQIRQIVQAGGRTFRVHHKDGRWHRTHRVVVTKAGAVFFADHGMCSPHALIAEYELMEPFDRRDLFARDSCHALAMYLANREFFQKYQPGSVVPFQPSRYRYPPPGDGMSRELREYWSKEAYQFISEVHKVRSERVVYQMPVDDPAANGIPMLHSFYKRSDALRQRMSTNLADKINRVFGRLKQKDIPQLRGYGSITHEELKNLRELTELRARRNKG